jgi:GT2 family glycosyltransferase
MPKLVEYVNPNPYTVSITGPDKQTVRINKYAKVVLSDWFIGRYTAKLLGVVRVLSEDSAIPVATPSSAPTIPATRPSKLLGKTRRNSNVKKRVAGAFSGVRSGRNVVRRRPRIVGKAIAHAAEVYNQAVQDVSVAISNNIGVGILSYNRLSVLQRLINSIRRFTDLSRTTVFVSDDGSPDQHVREWLSHQKDIVTLNNKHRVGISANSNRLLNCLSRFKHKIILNDDVEILNTNWERFYFEAMEKTGYHHFCYRQHGLYGASQDDGHRKKVGGMIISTVQEKPHGAVMAIDDAAFKRIGYFDEDLDNYGMEHVDWSNRVGLAGLQPKGFHDVIGSERFFKIYRERSAFVQKGRCLRENKAKYERLRNNSKRVFVNCSNKSAVPTISVIIPIRDIGRTDSIRTVIDSIRAQRFPAIEMTLVEQDGEKKFHVEQIQPIRYMFVPNTKPHQDFNKSRAFNQAVINTTTNKVVLHDADIVVQADYLNTIFNLLNDFEGCHIGNKVMYLDPSSTAQMCHSAHLDKSYSCERAVGYFEGGSIAFRKSTYFNIGGFNEAYEGYGVEDCDFFERLKKHSHFFNQRTVDMFHLWHSRIPGWSERHKVNKKLAETINRTMKDKSYVTHLVGQLKAKYPAAKKFYNG